MKARGRPKKLPEDRMDVVLRVRLTQEEHRRFAASTEERSMSDVIRDLIAQYVRESERERANDTWRAW